MVKHTKKLKRRVARRRNTRIRKHRGGMDPSPYNSSSNKKPANKPMDPSSSNHTGTAGAGSGAGSGAIAAEPSTEAIWNAVDNVLEKLMSEFVARTNPDAEEADYNETLEAMGDGYGDYTEVVDEIVKRLKSRFTKQQLAAGMKYAADNMGYTMFNDFIALYTVPTLSSVENKRLRESLAGVLRGDWDTHEYSAFGLGHPIDGIVARAEDYKRRERYWGDNFATAREYLDRVISWLESNARDATWAGKSQKVIPLELWSKVFA